MRLTVRTADWPPLLGACAAAFSLGPGLDSLALCRALVAIGDTVSTAYRRPLLRAEAAFRAFSLFPRLDTLTLC